MRGNLEAKYEVAVGNVRQLHLDRLNALGVSSASLAHVGSAHPPFGVLAGVGGADGMFLPGDGPAHLVQPVIENGHLIDLAAWRPDNPGRWWLHNGLGWMMNVDTAFATRWVGSRLQLHPTPLSWLAAFGQGSVVLDWSSDQLTWLRGFSELACSTEMLAATLRPALSRVPGLQSINVQEVRNAA